MGTDFTAPDLVNGSMINGFGLANQWATEIQSVLVISRDGRDDTAYLGQECRAESVIGASGGKDTIFRGSAYEMCVAQTWDNAIIFRAGAYLSPASPWKAGKNRTGVFEYPSKVVCPDVEARVISKDTLYSDLVKKNVSIRNLFMRISWESGDERISIYCPLRYINFPRDQESWYLQPISGHVLYYDEGIFYIAYVACSVNSESSEARIELVCRMPTSILELKSKGVIAKMISVLLDLTRLSKGLLMDDFMKRVVLSGACEFYKYKQP